VRAVLDPNVLIAAVLSRNGTPALMLRSWLDGRFDLVVSKALLTELERALRYPKLKARVSDDERTRFLELLRSAAIAAEDPADAPHVSDDAGDDYLIALAHAQQAVLVSGDQHLLTLAGRLPITSPSAFLDSLPD
jgi:putative PIN family toxin of toxin-antitoxin system